MARRVSIQQDWIDEKPCYVSPNPTAFEELRREDARWMAMRNGLCCLLRLTLTNPRMTGKAKSLDGGGQPGLWALGLDQQPCIRAEPKDAREVWKAARTRKSYGDGLALEGQFCGTLRTFVQI